MNKQLKSKVYGNIEELNGFRILRCEEENKMSIEERETFYAKIRQHFLESPYNSEEIDKQHKSFATAFKLFKPIIDKKVKYKLINGDQIPRGNGPYLDIANHSSNWDPPILMSIVGQEPVHLMLKYEFWGQLFGNLLSKIGINFVDRRSDRSRLNSAHEQTKLLYHGHNGIVFPEGHRNLEPDDVILQEVKIGAAFMAKVAKGTIRVFAITKYHKQEMRLVRYVGTIELCENKMLHDIKEEMKSMLIKGILDNRADIECEELAKSKEFKGKVKIFTR